MKKILFSLLLVMDKRYFFIKLFLFGYLFSLFDGFVCATFNSFGQDKENVLSVSSERTFLR